VVSFGVRTDTKAAVVILTAPDGNVLPVGSSGRLGDGEAFVVGYDGRAYLKGLAAENTVMVTLAEHECAASFPFAPAADDQVVIGPVVCQ
jgi:outer membrane usher protein